MSSIDPYLQAVGQFVARFLGGPAAHAVVVWQAAVSTASVLAGLVSQEIAKDLRDYRDELKKRMEAKTAREQAETARVAAEAQEAANKAARTKRTRAIQKLDEEQQRVEIEHKRIESAKTQAEADVLKAEAEQKKAEAHRTRLEAGANARAALIDAIVKLKEHGGEIYFDPENLRDIMNLPAPAPEDDPEPRDDALPCRLYISRSTIP